MRQPPAFFAAKGGLSTPPRSTEFRMVKFARPPGEIDAVTAGEYVFRMTQFTCNEGLATPVEIFLYSMMHAKVDTFDYSYFDEFFNQFAGAICSNCRERFAHYAFQRLREGKKQLDNWDKSIYLKRMGSMPNNCTGFIPEQLPWTYGIPVWEQRNAKS